MHEMKVVERGQYVLNWRRRQAIWVAQILLLDAAYHARLDLCILDFHIRKGVLYTRDHDNRRSELQLRDVEVYNFNRGEITAVSVTLIFVDTGDLQEYEADLGPALSRRLVRQIESRRIAKEEET